MKCHSSSRVCGGDPRVDFFVGILFVLPAYAGVIPDIREFPMAIDVLPAYAG